MPPLGPAFSGSWEPAIADTLLFALRTEGFDPSWVDLGGLALEAVRRAPPALIILDIGLPDLSGFEVCRTLRTFSDLPVLFLAARDAEVDRIMGLEIGGDDYVTKPFSPREVAARFRTILRRARPAMVPMGFRVDPMARRITFRGQRLDLTRYEYELLRTLLARPQRICTRTELMESVWAGSEETQERTVDTHIKALRTKIHALSPDAEQTAGGLGGSARRDLSRAQGTPA